MDIGTYDRYALDGTIAGTTPLDSGIVLTIEAIGALPVMLILGWSLRCLYDQVESSLGN